MFFKWKILQFYRTAFSLMLYWYEKSEKNTIPVSAKDKLKTLIKNINKSLHIFVYTKNFNYKFTLL